MFLIILHHCRMEQILSLVLSLNTIQNYNNVMYGFFFLLVNVLLLWQRRYYIKVELNVRALIYV